MTPLAEVVIKVGGMREGADFWTPVWKVEVDDAFHIRKSSIMFFLPPASATTIQLIVEFSFGRTEMRAVYIPVSAELL